jgi:hypothetical protein
MKDIVVTPEDMRLTDLRSCAPRTTVAKAATLCALVLMTCLIIGLFSAPVTWNEIFLTASLKDIATLPSMPLGTVLIAVPEVNVELPKAQHYPPWIIAPLTAFISLAGTIPGLASIHPLGPEVLSVRIFTALLALLGIPLLLRSISFTTPLSKNFIPHSNKISWLETTTLAAFLLFFARTGGIEQLLVILSLAMLWFGQGHPPSEARSLWQGRARVSASAALLALSHSATWIYAIASASLLFLLLYRRQWLWFKKNVLWAIAFGALVLSVLYLTMSSYEGLVHSFTLRWLYEFDMRHSHWGWPGSSFVFRIVSLLLMLMALRRMAIGFRSTHALRTPEAFLVCTTLCAGVFIAFRQINPTFEDLLLQVSLFFCSTRLRTQQSVSLHRPLVVGAPFSESFLQRADQLIFRIALAAGSLLTLFVILLLAAPETSALPELLTWMAALRSSVQELKFELMIMSALAAVLLTAALKRAQKTHADRTLVLLLSVVFFLHLGAFVRSNILWNHYRQLTLAIPNSHTLLYLPPLAPFVALQASPHTKHMAVPVQSGDAGIPPQDRMTLILPAHLSDLCRAMNWSIESTHGIFAVCTMERGSLWKMVLLN